VIEKEKSTSTSSHKPQTYRKDSMKDILTQQNESNSAPGRLLISSMNSSILFFISVPINHKIGKLDTTSIRSSGDSNSVAGLSVMQRTALNSIRNDVDNNNSSISRTNSSNHQDRQSQQSNSARGNNTPRGVSNKHWDVSVDNKVVMLRLLSAEKNNVNESFSPQQPPSTTIGTSSTAARMQLSMNSTGNASEEDYMNESFSSDS